MVEATRRLIYRVCPFHVADVSSFRTCPTPTITVRGGREECDKWHTVNVYTETFPSIRIVLRPPCPVVFAIHARRRKSRYGLIISF